MKLSYDYEEFIVELQEEIEDGVLTTESIIQIMRGKEIAGTGYRPIIDWYYNPAEMIVMCNPEIDDDELDIVEKKNIWDRYIEDAPMLNMAKLGDVLSEMIERNQIF